MQPIGLNGGGDHSVKYSGNLHSEFTQQIYLQIYSVLSEFTQENTLEIYS